MPRSWPHPLLDILHVEKPIIQAPMAGVQDYRLAAAVTNAGGLGSLPCPCRLRSTQRWQTSQTVS